LAQSASVRPPVQARSRRTLGRIVEASLALISDLGRDALTVQDVVARARISVGSFYARFSGRDELLRYLDEEMAARERGRWEGAFAARITADSPLEERVRAVVELLMGSAAALSAESHAHLRATAAATVLANRRGLRHSDPEAAVELAYAATLGAVRNRPAGWSDERVGEELVRMWLGYLGAATGRSEDSKGGVDFFDVWA
jgi:AcrR family transcriptional regulator